MSLFTAVEMAPRDPILGLNEQFAADTNPNKVNLGVGVYFDDNGKLPLLQCVQAAEKTMMATPSARGYLPIDGIAAYDAAVKGLVLGLLLGVPMIGLVLWLMQAGGAQWWAWAWAALVWAAALGLWLWAHYRARPVWLRRGAEVMMVLAVVTAGSALMSLRTYGVLAQRGIAVVAQADPCPAGYHCANATSAGTICPVGYFCPLASVAPTLCTGGCCTTPGLAAQASCSATPSTMARRLSSWRWQYQKLTGLKA